MVSAGKIFSVREKAGLDVIASKLKGYRKEEIYTEEGFEHKLVTDIQNLTMKPDTLEGVFSYDRLVHIPHRDGVIPVPRTKETRFAFKEYDDGLLLTVLEKKWQANNIANTLSEILFITSGGIVEAKISSENLRRYHEQNLGGTKVIFFSDIDIPNVNKLSLYGASLADAGLYAEFLTHGDIWYIVVTSKRYGYIVGVTGNAIVTVFNQIDSTNFLAYVSDEVFPLIEK